MISHNYISQSYFAIFENFSLEFEPFEVLEPVFYAMKNEARFESIRDVRKYLILLERF